MRNKPQTAEEWLYFNDNDFDTRAGSEDVFVQLKATKLSDIPVTISGQPTENMTVNSALVQTRAVLDEHLK